MNKLVYNKMKKQNQNQKISEKFKYTPFDIISTNQIKNQIKIQSPFIVRDIKTQFHSHKIKNIQFNQTISNRFKNIYARSNQAYNSNISKSMAKFNSLKKDNRESIQFKSLQKKRSSVLRDKIIKQYGNSPYIKNIRDFDKIERLMTPAKQPTQSIKLQIKRHNHTSHNIRNHQNVILRSGQNFQQKIQTFLQRLGLSKGSKTFIMNSKDSHIKQELLLRGWHELQDRDSNLFHLKWVYIDNALDYSKLHNSQFYNHFNNNQQLTNKNNLRKNVKMFPKNQRPNLPLTYDLGLKEDYHDFQQTYFVFRSIKILKTLVDIISKFNFKYYERIMKNKNYFLHQKYNKQSDQNNNSKERIKSKIFTKGTIKKQSIYLEKITDSYNEKEQIKKTLQILTINKSFIDQKNEQNRTSCENIFMQEFFMFICSMTNILTQKAGIIYSFFKFSQQSAALWKVKKHKVVQNIENKLNNTLEIINILQKFSNFFIVEIVKIAIHFQKIFSTSYGNNNAWIIKPVGVSRGAGISIKTNYYQIASNKNAKIVQKYIQRPLLLNCKRKFDIRQWILVKQFSPLQVYIYKNCYGRLCPEVYTSSDYQNLAKHLTNFSLFKQLYKKNSLNSIILETHIIQELGDQMWKKIKNQIKFQIIKTLKCCQHQVIQSHQNTFQIYGFDIMIDQNYKPWVIEVNLSPACEKREGLDIYLKEMAMGIVDMVQNKSLLSNWELLQQQQIVDFAIQQNQMKVKQESASKICRFLKKHKKIKQHKAFIKIKQHKALHNSFYKIQSAFE